MAGRKREKAGERGGEQRKREKWENVVLHTFSCCHNISEQCKLCLRAWKIAKMALVQPTPLPGSFTKSVLLIVQIAFNALNTNCSQRERRQRPHLLQLQQQ